MLLTFPAVRFHHFVIPLSVFFSFGFRLLHSFFITLFCFVVFSVLLGLQIGLGIGLCWLFVGFGFIATLMLPIAFQHFCLRFVGPPTDINHVYNSNNLLMLGVVKAVIPLSTGVRGLQLL